MKDNTYQEDKIKSLILMIFTGVIAIGFFLYALDNTPLRNSMDLFCQEHGYGERTDHKTMGSRCDWDYKVECDGEGIFLVEEEPSCTELNKWNDCVRWNNTLVMSDGGICYG